MLPTLLQEDTIVPAPWMKDKREAVSYVAIDYMAKYFSTRLPQKRHQAIGKSAGDKVFIVKSGTGSGKSTVIPPMLYNKFYGAIGRNIAVTQPRVFTAIDIPNRILEHNTEFKLGDNIGYQTGPAKKNPAKGLVFMTIGVLLQQLKTMSDEEFMHKYMIIMVDECHVRSIENDLVMTYLKRLLDRQFAHEDCPSIILASATFDHTIWIDYFDVPRDHYLEVRGHSFPITEIWPETPIRELDVYIEQTVRNICTTEQSSEEKIERPGASDIIIFIDTTVAAENVRTRLDRLNNDKDFVRTYGKLLLIVLNRTNYDKSDKDYENLVMPLAKLGNWYKKVFIATNMAETGITIEGLRYCIDTGFQMQPEFDPVSGMFVQISKAVTQAASTQRRGRVGRIAPGVWYPLYTKAMFAAFAIDTLPDVLTTDITLGLLAHIINSAGLSMKTYTNKGKLIQDIEVANDMVSLAEFDWPTPPSSASIIYALEKLYMLGFITTDNIAKSYIIRGAVQTAYMPTVMGIICNRFRKLRCEFVRMILSAYVHDADVGNLLTIAAFQNKTLNFRKKYQPFNPMQVDSAEALMYYRQFGDEFIEFVWMYQELCARINRTKSNSAAIDAIYKFCDEYQIPANRLLEGIAFRDELVELLLALGLNPGTTKYNISEIIKGDLSDGIDEIRKIKACIYDGFRTNLATYNPSLDAYVLVHYRQVIGTIKSQLVQTIFKDELRAEVTQKKPRNIIVYNCTLRNGRVEAESPISILDGFVEVDERMASQ